MSTITAILEAHADGSLHLPLPAELQHRRVRVEAKLEVVDEIEGDGRLATPEMLAQRKEALASLRALGGLRDPSPGSASSGKIARFPDAIEAAGHPPPRRCSSTRISSSTPRSPKALF